MSELKPCPFCRGNRDRITEAFMDGWAKIIEADGHFALSAEDNDATTSLVFNINYCPICGRELNRRAQPTNEPKECPAMERVEGGIPYCADKQTACDGCKPANEPLVRCGECANYQTQNCAAKHEQALMDFCSHGIRKPGGEQDA